MHTFICPKQVNVCPVFLGLHEKTTVDDKTSLTWVLSTHDIEQPISLLTGILYVQYDKNHSSIYREQLLNVVWLQF